MKNIRLLMLVLLINSSYCFGQTVTTLVSNHTVEYECLPSYSTYTKDLTNKWMVTGLENDVNYRITISSPTIFDAVTFEAHSSFWEVVNHSNPYYQTWKWISQTTTRDTFDLAVDSDYTSLESGVGQLFQFGIIKLPNGPGSSALSGVDIASSIELTGPSIVCGTAATFNLSNLPFLDTTSWATSWVIKQNGITRASGTGTTASTSNLTNGDAEVKFTVNFNCGLSPLYFTSEFWVGVPIPTITGESYLECYERSWYFLDPEDQWGSYSWSVSNNLRIIGSALGYKAFVEARSEGQGAIYCSVTNTCGTGYGSLYVWVDCFDFFISPNPANDLVNISIDDSKIDVSSLKEYEINIYNNQNILVYKMITNDAFVSINISDFIAGIYTVKLIYDKKEYSKHLVVGN